jgi:uncharacterized membrane protein YhhN
MLRFLFLIVFIGQLASRYFASEVLDYIFKPLIMPCLAGLLLANASKNLLPNEKNFQQRILIGFLFSWIGDIALMLEKFNAVFFLIGLSAFLLAHIFYITAFYTSTQHKFAKTLLRRKPFLFLPLIAFGIVFYSFLFPNLRSFALPVLAYVVVICLMACFALNRRGVVNTQSFKLGFYGALWFMLSDSLIALGKFMFQVPMGGLWVMLTYMLAQYLIMRSAVTNKED